MVEKKIVEKSGKLSEKDERILIAFLACFLTIIGFFIAFLSKKDDKYVMFYAKHGIILFIGLVIVSLAEGFGSDFRFFTALLWVFWVILWVMTWINALSGKERETIIVTDLANKLKI
jgi:uncharacterized membrane protein